MCSQHCWGQGHSFWGSMCPKLIIICHLCWWLEPLGSATLFLQLALAVPGSLSSHCCSAAGACSSALCSQQDCQTHRDAQGPWLLTGGLLNRFPILPGQSSAFAPWITLTWADQVPSGLHNFTPASAYYKEEYLTLHASSKLCLRAVPLFLSCCQILTVLLLFWQEGSSSLQATAIRTAFV